MQVYRNKQLESEVLPRYCGRRITVAIDSSKRNTGLTIGDEFCNPIDVYDINGVGDGTGESDVLELCKKQREYLSVLLAKADVQLVGIENIVSVDKDTRGGGIAYHMSRFKITAVFMSFITFFQDAFGVTAELINNQTWKSAVLPREFTSRSVGKGSLAYFKSIQSRYANYTDDATDSICIMQYMKLAHKLQDFFRVQEAEVKRFESRTEIMRVDTKMVDEVSLRFEYCEQLTLEQNVIVMANHLGKKTMAYARIPIGVLTVPEIYLYATGEFPECVSEVLLVVRRLT